MIRYIGGVEGSGKSCMMTRDLCLHAVAGGRLLTFPGYDVYDKHKHVISETIMPEQLLELITGDDEQIQKIRAQKIAVGVDEVPNFFNHHTWYNKINDILTSILQQRRKLNIIFEMTGPIFEELPPDIRRMIHEVVHCTDLHTLNRNVPVGKYSIYYKEDRRGLLSHPQYHFTSKRRFHMEPWHKHYNTYAAINPLNQFVRVKFQSKELTYDTEGNLLNKLPELDTGSFDGILEKHMPPAEDPMVSRVKEVVRYLQNKQVEKVGSTVINELMPGYQIAGPAGIGSILKKLGAIYSRHTKTYDFTNVNVE
jgi:hypothetical protein